MQFLKETSHWPKLSFKIKSVCFRHIYWRLSRTWRSATERTPSVVPEESPLWGSSATHRMAQPYGVPDQFRELVGCWIAVEQPYGYRVVSYRVDTTAYALWCYYINYVVVLSLREVHSKYNNSSMRGRSPHLLKIQRTSIVQDDTRSGGNLFRRT